MKLIQSRKIPTDDLWEPCLDGYFYEDTNSPCFAYIGWNTLCLLPLNSDMPAITQLDVSLPHDWLIVKHEGLPYLFIVKPTVPYHLGRRKQLSNVIVVDLRQGKQLLNIPESLQSKYFATAQPDFVEGSFCFDDYCVSHKGYSGYRCTKADKTIWEFSGRAYLYTEIKRWNNRLFFGTAGHGGYFYVLDIDTGESIASIKTGGTAHIVQRDHVCYIGCAEGRRNRSKLLCIDLRDGSIVEAMDLYGRASFHSKLQIIGQQLHFVTFEYKDDIMQKAIWSTVDL